MDNEKEKRKRISGGDELRDVDVGRGWQGQWAMLISPFKYSST